MFLPFSDRAKKWEPHALRLRSMVREGNGAITFDPFKLAPRVGLTVQACDFTGLNEAEKQYLITTGRSSWSGGIFPTPLPDGTRLCMLNPLQSPRRSRITLMEEIVHAYLKHEPTALVVNEMGFLVRDYNKAQEEEAYGIGAAALMPWTLFFPPLNRGAPIEQIAETFDVTTQLVEYRIKTSGATALFRARVRKAASAQIH